MLNRISPLSIFPSHRFLACVLLFLIGLGNGACSTSGNRAAASREWSGPFFFMILADTQLGYATENKDMVREIETMDQAIESVNRLKPSFVVFTGDQIHKAGDETQIAEFRRLVGKLDKSIPVYYVVGNHDVTNQPKESDLATYRGNFGKDYYSFDFNGCHCVVMDSSLIRAAATLPDEDKAQMEWLKQDLAKSVEASPRQTLLFIHHAPFLKTADEAAVYDNLPEEPRAELLEICRQYGVDAIFSGHLHYTLSAKTDYLQLHVAGSVSKPNRSNPSGFSIVKVYPDRVEHEFVGLDMAPDSVELK